MVSAGLVAGFALLALLIGGIVGSLIGARTQKFLSEMDRLRKENNQLRRAAAKEHKKRLPHNIDDGLLNTLSMSNRGLFEARQTLKYVGDILTRINNEISEIRSDPLGYDPDQPASAPPMRGPIDPDVVASLSLEKKPSKK